MSEAANTGLLEVDVGVRGIMSEKLSPQAQKVQDVLTKLGFQYQVVESPRTTRSAADAAQAIGCQVEQIAKSLVFRTGETGRAILVIASGPNRVNEKELAHRCGEPIEKADADFVKDRTGFAIGGVPPIGHSRPLVTFIDEDLLRYEEIWAAAGTPNAVFRLSSGDLAAMTKGKVLPVK
jgi:prolyl-tRNA editing enzyme YbaK/EbsC (Cys-tRNA(Pro) deacylase)